MLKLRHEERGTHGGSAITHGWVPVSTCAGSLGLSTLLSVCM
jgi:hypothetical protein